MRVGRQTMPRSGHTDGHVDCTAPITLTVMIIALMILSPIGAAPMRSGAFFASASSDAASPFRDGRDRCRAAAWPEQQMGRSSTRVVGAAAEAAACLPSMPCWPAAA